MITCFIFNDGKTWWNNAAGDTHNNYGPARILNESSKWLYTLSNPSNPHTNNICEEWWVNNKLHRTDGPAVNAYNIRKEW